MPQTALTTAFPPAAARLALPLIEQLTAAGGSITSSDERSCVQQICDLLDDEQARLFRDHPSTVLAPLSDVGAVSVDYDSKRWIHRITLHDSALDLLPFLQERSRQTTARGLRAPGAVERRAARGMSISDLVLNELREHGPVVSNGASATAVLGARLGETSVAIGQALRTLARRGLVETEMHARVIRRISLAEQSQSAPAAADDDDAGVDALLERDAPETHTAQSDDDRSYRWDPSSDEWVPVDDEPQSAVEPEPLPTVDAVEPVAADVALALLNIVIERATRAMEPDHRVAFLTTELADAQKRLASATEYAGVERRRAREAADELIAVKSERDMLRQRLTSVERNLSEMMRENGRTSTTAFRDGVQHALNGLMRELPTLRQ